jgi:hypothetical protein
MKKVILFLTVSAFLGFTALSASADNTVPGSYDQAGMGAGIGVSVSMMQMGAADRALTNAVNLNSRAGSARSISGVHQDYQFGSSQMDQSWKAAKTVEEAQVRGLVPGDCQGDNSDGAYRQQMNQNRNGYMKERLVSNSQCGEYHPTLK